jgi:predicted transposase YbfD/YdcC
VVHGQALDGKAVRGAQAHGTPVHLLSLVRHGSGVTLAQQVVARKTNEIKVAPQLLAGCNLIGTVTTMDALLTQRDVAQQILDQHGHYLMVAKHNQPHVWAAIDQLFQTLPLPSNSAEGGRYTYTQTEHGRLETRTLLCRTAPPEHPLWPGLNQVIQRSCQRIILCTGEIQEETTYGLTSLASEQAGPEQLEQVWRGHWTTENRVHYVRDETLGEDRCQVHTGHAPQALAALRNSILTLLRHRGWHNIAEALRHFGASVQRALSVIGAIAT